MESRRRHLADMIDMCCEELARHDARCLTDRVRREDVERANKYREILGDYVSMLADAIADDGKPRSFAREEAGEYAHHVYTREFAKNCEPIYSIDSDDCEVEY